MRRGLLVVLVTVLLAAGACGDDGDDAGAPTTTPDTVPERSTTAPTTTIAPATTTTPTTTPPEGPDPLGEPRTDPYQTPDFLTGGELALLTDVRVGRHEGFDRVTFELDGAVPEFAIEYVDGPIRENPSGRELDVAGDAFLDLTLSPATGVDLSGPEPRETYEGPGRLPFPDGATAIEVVQTSDFEGILSWVIGLPERVPYSFATLDGPPRLVVDLRTADA